MGLSSRQCLSNVPNIGLLSRILVLLLFHVLGAGSLYSRQQQPSSCHDEDSAALLQFKQSFIIDPSVSYDDGSCPKVSSWKTAEGDHNSNCCSWDGVECDEDTGHVTGLDLSSSCLYGSINSSSSLFRLVHLRRLNLADNHFNYSEIPTTIRNLPRLRYLNLSLSVFSGQVPSEITQLSKLSSLDLSRNLHAHSDEPLLKLKVPNLAGLVQNLTRLEKLHLSYVNISSKIPDSLVNLSFLSSLTLGNCDLYGEFPIRIFKLQYLTFLSVRSNQELSGYLPDFNGSSPLTWLSLGGTNFSRNVPSSIRKLDALNYLNLAECSFSGPIPASLANLTQLNYLSLATNNFVGGPLSWLGKQTELTSLHLTSTNLNGPIPVSLGNLTQLTDLFLDENQLSGPIPPLLGNLSRVTNLDLSDNRLSGLIPESLFNLNLSELSLFGNNLHGKLDICRLPSTLIQLQLGGNKLEVSQSKIMNTTLFPKLSTLVLCACNINEFPDFLRHQQNLNWLALSFNKLHGQIPKWMLNTSTESLMFLDLKHNFLSDFGQLNVVLPWVNLKVLFVGQNLLDGSPPIPPQSIIYYSFDNNNLTGELSQLMCNISTLQYVDFSNNKLSGTIPPCLGNFSDDLQVLVLRNNSFHGTLPQRYSNTSNLKMLDVSYNQLHGKIPRSLANCVMLESLVLSVNKFSDVFPFWLASLPELKLLAMHHNAFYGVIGNTKENLHFPELRILDLSYNNFRGEFPSEYIFSGNAMRGIVLSQPTYMEASSDLNIPNVNAPRFSYSFTVTISNKGFERYYGHIQEDLGVIDISSNNFRGKIPEFIGNLKGLRFLNISNNIFNGSIPSFLENLTLLEALDLSQNQLSGEIPQQLVQLTSLANFNVSYNNLTGSIPQGRQFQTFENTSYKGNPELCGDPLTRRCGNSIAPAQLPPSNSIEENVSGSAFELDWKFVLAGFGSGLLVGVVLADVAITRRRELFLEIVGMLIRLMKRIKRQRRY
ncbi:putative leucine-rich repeat-containing, plant-type, leucine-rich repeat domain, L [Rosa chinensis]|uniref:Putative leucine-rich repeat-containing, plant-type, leucine-rich repeat domain, L n=1 Tax=Rosa chinensis TaxID=74649 RepID=A0A2P6SDE3_ROSCH|nr:receptor-like protein 7 [Rosa chinensis]PRQ56711.1 putative leucine-rich repeat-containing, plant-type, leucine-rich repeat domain, L [Rosa chinensis]